jgi:hypothetical protein
MRISVPFLIFAFSMMLMVSTVCYHMGYHDGRITSSQAWTKLMVENGSAAYTYNDNGMMVLSSLTACKAKKGHK